MLPARRQFEEGEMLYELRKWLETGDVEFRLHAVSRPRPPRDRAGNRAAVRHHRSDRAHLGKGMT